MKTPRKSPGLTNPRTVAALSTHVTARKLIEILSGGESFLGKEIKADYETGEIDFSKLAEKYTFRLNKLLGTTPISETTYRSILHRVLAGYKGGRGVESYEGLFTHDEYPEVKTRRNLAIARLCHAKRSEREGRINWTPEMEQMLMKLDGLTKQYQPGKLLGIIEIMEQIYQIPFPRMAVAGKLTLLRKQKTP